MPLLHALRRDTSEEVRAAAAVMAASCGLAPRWVVKQTFPQLADAKVYLDRWVEGRRVTITFQDEQLGITNTERAFVETTVSTSGTVATFTLGKLGAEFICETGHVDDDGNFVRDMNCNDNGDDPNGGGPFFSFQVQPGVSGMPEILCPEPLEVESVDAAALPSISPPPYVVRSPPPIPPSPPPLLPRVEADAACLAGGTATVTRSMMDRDFQIWRVVVKPAYLWPTGYMYIVGVQGQHLEVSFVEGAEMAPRGDTEHSYDEVQLLAFVPSPVERDMAFNLKGSTLRLRSLACELHSPSPPPPASPPLPPAEIDWLKITGLQSRTSQLSVGIISLLACLSLVKNSGVVWRIRRCVCGRTTQGHYPHGIPSPKDSWRAGKSCRGAARVSSMPDIDEDVETWSVILQLGGRELEAPPLPMEGLTSLSELKEALVTTTMDVIGASRTPSEWVQGDVRSMRVQYLTTQVPCTHSVQRLRP